MLKRSPLEACHWASILVTGMWNFMSAILQHRNTVVHGSTVEEQALIVLEKLRVLVTRFYDTFTQTPSLPWYHHLFTSQSLERCLQYPFDHIKCWLQLVEEAVQV
jgi:hypothetical protein